MKEIISSTIQIHDGDENGLRVFASQDKVSPQNFTAKPQTSTKAMLFSTAETELDGSLDLDFVNEWRDDDFYTTSSDILLGSNELFSSLLEEKDLLRNSLPSSTCPSVTSDDISSADFDYSILDGDLDLFEFNERNQEALSPRRENRNSSEFINRRQKSRSPSTKVKCSNNKNCFQKDKFTNKNCTQRKWSLLNTDEQTERLQSLMDTVSKKFGLREQLDIIKIINPNVCIAPSATEFFIDFDSINDENFELMNRYITKQLNHLKTDTIEKHDSTMKNRINRCKKKVLFQDNIVPHKKRSERKMKAFNTSMKRYRQLRKEKKSGLFSKEEVVAMVSQQAKAAIEHENVDDEEIDVLT